MLVPRHKRSLNSVPNSALSTKCPSMASAGWSAVQKATFARDAVGQKRATFATVATIRGLLKPLRGREAVNAQQVKAEVSAVFETRYQASLVTIDEAMQLVIEGKVYKVGAVIDVDLRHKTLEIYCTEVSVPQ